MRPDRRTCVHVLLLIVLTALVFSNTLRNDYHLDSIYRVADNTEIDRIWPPWRFFTDPRTASTVRRIVDYRPMMPLSHAVDVALAKRLGIDRLTGFHLGNIAIHVATSILLYLLFRELMIHYSRIAATRSRHCDLAFATALLFAVHPVSGVPVNYIAGRDLLLMMLFLTAAMLVYARMRRRTESVGGWCAVLALLALSLLSKTNAMVAFGLVLAFELVLAGAAVRDWRPWARTGGVGALGGIFAWLNLRLGDSASGLRSMDMASVLDYPLTQLDLHLFYYVRNFVWPFQMRAQPRIERVTDFLDVGAIVGAAFVLATLVLAWYFRRRCPLAAFSILAYWILFAVTSSIIPLRDLAVDYRQYPSLAFLCATVVIALHAVARYRVAVAAVATLVAYFGVSSYAMNATWRTEESFWGHSVRRGGNALAHTNYAHSVMARDPALAERHFREAIRLYPNHIYANINLGLLHVRQGRASEGLLLLRTVVAPNPTWARSHYWLAVGLRLLGRDREALSEFGRAADLDRRGLSYQHAVAAALQRAGDHAASIPYLERLLRYDPGYRDSLFLLGFAHQKAGLRDRAIEEYGRFLRARPNHFQAQFNLAYALMKNGDCDAAVPRFIRVLELRPGYTETHQHLATCYRALGEPTKAGEHAAIHDRARRKPTGP